MALSGDTDSTAAIVGSFIGATAGADAIPTPWLEGRIEFPRSVEWMRGLAADLAERQDRISSTLACFPLLLTRDLILAAIRARARRATTIPGLPNGNVGAQVAEPFRR